MCFYHSSADKLSDPMWYYLIVAIIAWSSIPQTLLAARSSPLPSSDYQRFGTYVRWSR